MQQKHVSMIGVGVTAIGVLAAVIYYRHAESIAASNAANSTAAQQASLLPLFQTAAIPTSGTTAPASGIVAATGLTASTLSSLFSGLTDALRASMPSASAVNAPAGISATTINAPQNFGSLLLSVSDQLLSQGLAQSGTAHYGDFAGSVNYIPDLTTGGGTFSANFGVPPATSGLADAVAARTAGFYSPNSGLQVGPQPIAPPPSAMAANPAETHNFIGDVSAGSAPGSQ